jgi:hypothetical protein
MNFSIPSPSVSENSDATTPVAPIDLEVLAERIYRLFMAEIRNAQARGEQPKRGR